MERKLSMLLKDESQHVKLDEEEILPEDILVEILLRLPVRNLLCLRCVCKSWCALIDDVNFIKRHYELQYCICKADGDIPFICWGPQFKLFEQKFQVCILSKQFGDVPLDLRPDLVRDTTPCFATAPHLINDVFFVGCVKGLVCFIWGNRDLGLWNPATREFKAVTPWLYKSTLLYQLNLIGFGFDSISNDFKIVRGDGIRSYQVYSLATNSWKRIREPPSTFVFIGPFTMAYLNGVCYWSAYSRLSDPPLILSFNFSTEVFVVFHEPLNTIVGSETKFELDWEITVYKECLAVVFTRTDLVKAECNFDVWVVTEFDNDTGVPKSWQHLFTMGPFPPSDVIKIDRFRMDGDVLFAIRCPGPKEESSLYNLSTGKFKDFGYLLGCFFDYVESLFPVSKRLVQS